MSLCFWLEWLITAVRFDETMRNSKIHNIVQCSVWFVWREEWMSIGFDIFFSFFSFSITWCGQSFRFASIRTSCKYHQLRRMPHNRRCPYYRIAVRSFLVSEETKLPADHLSLVHIRIYFPTCLHEQSQYYLQLKTYTQFSVSIRDQLHSKWFRFKRFIFAPLDFQLRQPLLSKSCVVSQKKKKIVDRETEEENFAYSVGLVQFISVFVFSFSHFSLCLPEIAYLRCICIAIGTLSQFNVWIILANQVVVVKNSSILIRSRKSWVDDKANELVGLVEVLNDDGRR